MPADVSVWFVRPAAWLPWVGELEVCWSGLVGEPALGLPPSLSLLVGEFGWCFRGVAFGEPGLSNRLGLSLICLFFLRVALQRI